MMIKVLKKAQTAEFLSIALLMLIITIFALTSRFSHMGKEISETKGVITNVKTSNIQLVSQVLPFSTIKGIPVEELFGDLSCYGKRKVNYSNDPDVDINIDIFNELRRKLDALYGKDNWAIYLETGEVSFPKVYFYYDNSDSMEETKRLVFNVMKGITHGNYDAITIEDLFSAKGKYSNGRDDLDCSKFNNHPSNCDAGENWGGAVAFISKNGPPPYDGWNDSEARVIFISSDEESCSSTGEVPGVRVCKNLCEYGTTLYHYDCCNGEQGNTKAWVDFAIERAKENNVKVFFIVPRKIYVMRNKQAWLDNVQRLCEETGGKVISISSDGTNGIAKMILENVPVRTKSIYLTSSYNGTKKILPKKDFMSYDFFYPLPCAPEKQGVGALMVAQG